MTEKTPILINTLPSNHPIRNTPLIQLNAYYLPKDGIAWREVFPAFNIAMKTYNELGEVWTKNDLWKTNSDLAYKLEDEYLDKRMDIIGSNSNEGLHYE